MQSLKVDVHAPQYELIKKIADVLAAGGVVCMPTETVYGIAGDATNAKAINKIYNLKGRPEYIPLSLHLADISWIGDLKVQISKIAEKLIEKYLPGPLTIVLPTYDGNWQGIRVSSLALLREVLYAFGKPVVMPSANLHNYPSTTTAEDAASQLKGELDMLVDGGLCELGMDSTVVRVNPSSTTIEILREGAITISELEKYFKVDTKSIKASSCYDFDVELIVVKDDLEEVADKFKDAVVLAEEDGSKLMRYFYQAIYKAHRTNKVCVIKLPKDNLLEFFHRKLNQFRNVKFL